MSDLVKRFKVGVLALSGAGLIAIANFEGFEEKAYIPVPGDDPTIGFGHKDERMPLDTFISVPDALKLLGQDTKHAEETIKKYVKVPLTQSEYDAYVSFSYNVGAGNFASSTLLNKLNASDYEGACNELRRWVFSSNVKYQGLVNRRDMENLICQHGVYPKNQLSDIIGNDLNP